jgi:hypothetical protein
MNYTIDMDEKRNARRAYEQAYREANKEKLRDQRRAYVEKNRAKVYETQRRWYAENRDQELQRYRRRTFRRYGMTMEDYERRLAGQDGRCACCGNADPRSPSGRFDIDHDHAKCAPCATGTRDGYNHGPVRALLCRPCNSMLGNASDDASRLRAGAEYLEHHKKVRN